MISLETAEWSYQISQDLGLVAEYIETIIGKSYILFSLNDYDLNQVDSYILEAERRLNSLANDFSRGIQL